MHTLYVCIRWRPEILQPWETQDNMMLWQFRYYCYDYCCCYCDNLVINIISCCYSAEYYRYYDFHRVRHRCHHHQCRLPSPLSARMVKWGGSFDCFDWREWLPCLIFQEITQPMASNLRWPKVHMDTQVMCNNPSVTCGSNRATCDFAIYIC